MTTFRETTATGERRNSHYRTAQKNK